MDRMTIFCRADTENGLLQAVICEIDYPHFYQKGFVSSVDDLDSAPDEHQTGVPEDYQHLQNVNELYQSSEKAVFDLLEEVTGQSIDRHDESIQSAVNKISAHLAARTTEFNEQLIALRTDNPPQPESPETTAKSDAPDTEQDGASRGPGRPAKNK